MLLNLIHWVILLICLHCQMGWIRTGRECQMWLIWLVFNESLLWVNLVPHEGSWILTNRSAACHCLWSETLRVSLGLRRPSVFMWMWVRPRLPSSPGQDGWCVMNDLWNDLALESCTEDELRDCAVEQLNSVYFCSTFQSSFRKWLFQCYNLASSLKKEEKKHWCTLYSS